MSNKPENETPILDELETEQALLHSMAEKVAFYTTWVAHLLMRLEAIAPESAVMMSPRHHAMAQGLPLNLGMTGEDAQGMTYAMFISVDQRSVEYVRVDEKARRMVNGIGIEGIAAELRRLEAGKRSTGAGIVGVDGKELESTRNTGTESGKSGTTGEVS